MQTKTGVLADQLVEELVQRSQGRAYLDAGAKGFLAQELERRLAHSQDPDGLYRRWQGNLDRYIGRAVPHTLPSGPVYVTEEMIRRQFSVCDELCPAPANPVTRGRSA
jgi:hypothetical protein